ncbi:hypothetical protein BN946_scf184908.g92 [Trametes cinnabarina]|uniref:Uncharacterized protein n=1 Tax=Pycnoporus cinnabarinus TaxID=5643 RepID=A0A060SGJ2_PYCCI|nr:hypothetical protein BN946_scf184908.g92 [Trametes cinnabarina]
MPAVARKSPPPPTETQDTPSPPPTDGPNTRWSGDSLLEKHAIASYRSQTLQHPPSLSVYELPTATYMWPRFDLALPSHKPMLSPVSELARSFTPPPTTSRKRSSSADLNDDATSPSDRLLKHRRISRYGSPTWMSSDRGTSSVASGRRYLRREQELQETLRMLGIESEDSDVDSRDVSVDRIARQSKSGHATAQGSTMSAAVDTTVAPKRFTAKTSPSFDYDPSRDEWMKYIRSYPDPISGPDYTCTWSISMPDGRTQECPYSSKKHLVKRHIESKHLQLRWVILPQSVETWLIGHW